MTVDYRERWNDPEEALLTALDAHSAKTWCSGPGIVNSVDFAAQTCTVRPAIMVRAQNQDTGTFTWVTLPLLLDCPIIFLSGGGFTVTVPLKKGDEVTVFFADRCIDGWWQSGQVSPQSEIRFHDLSDGFVLPGPRSKPNALPEISSDTLQVRTDDGTTYYELTGGQVVNVVGPQGINLTTQMNLELEATEEVNVVAATIAATAPTGITLTSAEVTLATALATVTGALTIGGELIATGGFGALGSWTYGGPSTPVQFGFAIGEPAAPAQPNTLFITKSATAGKFTLYVSDSTGTVYPLSLT